VKILQGQSYVSVEDARRRLDLYLPARKGTPLIIYVPGGAWISGDRAQYAELGTAFAANGIACAVINYRLASATTRHPAPVEDLASAIAWIGAHQDEYGYDAGKIFVMGHSAGAHAAASLATDADLLSRIPASHRPKGYIGLEGIYDLPHLVARWPGYRSWFVEAEFGQEEKGWIAASPARRLPVSHSPWLVVHSSSDELVDTAQSSDFAKHLSKAGIGAKLVVIAGKSHFGVLEALGTAEHPLAGDLSEFFQSTSKYHPALK
jgi:acetyl esterase/lipase